MLFTFLMLLVATSGLGDVHHRLLQVLGPDAGRRADTMVAEKHFAEVEAMLPASEKALRGVLEFMDGHMETAVKWFEDAGPLLEQDRFTLAMALVKLGRDGDARTELSKLATVYPTKALYPYWLGRLDYDQRRYTEAVDELKRATQLDAKSARAWDSLGLAYDMQGNAKDALAALQEAATLNRAQLHPSSWPPHDLGALLLRIGNLKQAELALREALRFDPAMQQAHYHLARTLEKEGEADAAVYEYRAALQVDDKAAEVYYSLAILYRKMHKDAEAEAAFSDWRRCKAAQPQ